MAPRSESRSVSPAAGSPAAAGFRMPAEWEPHEATWIGWPHNTADWPGKFSAIPWVYGEIVRKLAPGERVRALVASGARAARARRVLSSAGANPSRVELVRCATDRGWTRDCGPIFVHRDRPPPEAAVVRFRFNAWARYANWKQDDRLPEREARYLGYRLFQAVIDRRPFVLEGGAIDVNGCGSLLATEQCLLDRTRQVRNPGADRAAVECALRSNLGVTNILWLGSGIAGDDTHGHVDDLCRFVAPRTIVVCQEDNPRDANYRSLGENRERLEGMTLEDGSKPEIAYLPMPAPLYFRGRRLPASYANFYIANSAVLVPTFNDPNDRLALGVLSELIRDRPVIGIHAVDLVWGLGTIHCLTQQQPALRSK